jgi:hypothetical protein
MQCRLIGLSAAMLIAAGSADAPATAQLMDTLRNSAGSLGGLGVPSVGGASTGNIAGLLQYCAQNQLVGSGSASVKDSLLNKLGGAGKESHDPAFTSGSKGLVQSGGKGFDLSSMTDQVKQTICDQVLQRAKSLI